MSQLKIKPWQLILLLIGLIGVYYFLPLLGQLKDTLTVLRHTSKWWMLVGLFFTFLGYLAAAFTQFAAGDWSGLFSGVLILQFAGSFANHFLPFNLGSIGLTVRYYQNLGRKRAEALTVAILPTVFGVLTTVTLVILISPVTLAHLIGRFHTTQHDRWLVLLGFIAVSSGLLALPAYRRRAKEFIDQATEQLKRIKGARNLLSLTSGSLALTLCSAVALSVSVKAVHSTIGPADAFTLYVTSSLIGDIVPTPGGLGGTEAVLALGLSSVGLSLAQAVAATLLYRFVTFWLPMIPGGVFFRKFNQSNQE